MLGAILGDIIGSPYEFDCNNIKTTEFPLFSDCSYATDDSIMTLAVAEGIMNGWGSKDKTKSEIIKSMQRLGQMYPNAGYGINFSRWIESDNPKPYNSFGNGSAMRVSSVAWLFNNLCTVLEYAEISAEVTHNHPEGIKGAKATAAAIFFARNGCPKEKIQKYIETNFEYNLNRTLDEIRPGYHHVESCQKTVPEAITAFLEGNSFETVIRNAVSLGGDSDTLTAISGSIAEAFYGVPEALKVKALSMMDDKQKAILRRYQQFLRKTRAQHREKIAPLFDAIPKFKQDGKTEWFTPPSQNGAHHFAYPCYGEEVTVLEKIVQSEDFAVFDYGDVLKLFGIRMDIDEYLQAVPAANPLLLRAMLTSIVRQERFQDGLIAKAIENGLIVKILSALKKYESR